MTRARLVSVAALREPVADPRGLIAIPGLAAVCVVLGYALAHRPALVLVCTAVIAIGLLVAVRPGLGLGLVLLLTPMSALIVGGVPLNSAIMVVVAFAFGIYAVGTRHGLGGLRPPWWVAAALVVTLAIATVSLLVNDVFSLVSLKRMGHLALSFALLYLLARGAIENRTATRAVLAGLIISSVVGLLYLVTGHTADYGGRLVGLFGDPNVAGFQIVVLGTVVAGRLAPGRNRRLFVGMLAIALIATLSRTSLLAALVVVAWIVGTTGNRLLPALVFTLAVGLLVAFLPPQAQVAGPFANRTGSDALRQATLQATEQFAFSSPIAGHGPEPGRLPIPERPGVFLLPHNSYLAMIGEAGIFYLAVWLVFMGTVLTALIRAPERNRYLEAAILAIFVIAAELGAVLLEFPSVIALGLALCWVMQQAGSDSRSTSEPQQMSAGGEDASVRGGRRLEARRGALN